MAIRASAAHTNPVASGTVVPIRISPAVGSVRGFQSSDTLLQLVEDGDAGVAERLTVAGQLNAAPAAIEQPHAEGVLEIGNRLGDHRLRDREISSRAPHGAGVCDRHENAEVA